MNERQQRYEDALARAAQGLEPSPSETELGRLAFEAGTAPLKSWSRERMTGWTQAQRAHDALVATRDHPEDGGLGCGNVDCPTCIDVALLLAGCERLPADIG